LLLLYVLFFIFSLLLSLSLSLSVSLSLSLSLSLSFFRSFPHSFSAGCKIVERSIYGCKITHVKFETGRVYFKDLCATLDRGSKPNSLRKFVTWTFLDLDCFILYGNSADILASDYRIYIYVINPNITSFVQEY